MYGLKTKVLDKKHFSVIQDALEAAAALPGH
jgi:hypothetical protein